ncbi:MAG: hypothetical protein J1F12_03545 [Muribaculaceae bacterium]|nr:hypothetical protein [Muribaculaceae bacterium]
MTRYYGNTDYPPSRPGKKHHKRNPWKLTGIICAWVIGILIVVAACVFWGFSIYLSPDRITRMIEEESGKYLRADIKIGKLDYRLWHSYPWLEFEVDSLTVISKSLEGIPLSQRDSLPQNADFLASVIKIGGKINLHDLLHKNITIRDIEVERPVVNLVMVNDSISNYNIVPEIKGPHKIPEIDISEVEVIAPVKFSLFSLSGNLAADANVEDFFLTRNEKHNYRIGFNGDVKGKYGDYILADPLPLKFETGIKIAPPNLEILLNDLYFSLAGISFNAIGEITASGKGVDFNSAKFDIGIENIFTLLQYLPDQILNMLTLPEDLSGKLPINLKVELKKPYHLDLKEQPTLSLSELPAISAILRVDSGELLFSPKGIKPVFADNILLELSCDFNPENTEETQIILTNLSLSGEGIELEAFGKIDNVTGEDQTFSGEMKFHSAVMETLSYLVPKSGIKIGGQLRGEIEIEGTASNLGKNGLNDLKLAGDIRSRNLKVASNSTGNLNLKNIDARYKATLPQYPFNNKYDGTLLNLDLKADSITLKQNGLSLLLSDLNIDLSAGDTVSGAPNPYGTLLFNLGSVKATNATTLFTARDLEIKTAGALNADGQPSYQSYQFTGTQDNQLLEKRVPHTPLTVSYSGSGGMLQTVMNLMNLSSIIKIREGEFTSPSYLYSIDFSELEASTNLNDVEISSLNVKAGRSGMSLKGEIKGLKPFLTSYSPTYLKTQMEIDFTNVDINQLSWGYYGALIKQGKDSVFYVAPLKPFTAADSVCVLIPRNLDARIHLRSKSAEYMGYTFSPLSTDIIVNNGVATLKGLTIGAPYATAIVDWTYSTSQFDNIFMDLKARVKNFSFDPFYKVFPQLLIKAPELKDLTGQINADIDCNFLMFPDMFMNSESLRGDFTVEGSDMLFARQGKIEKITHLMLIEGDSPIQIQNFKIQGFYHDNLLQLNPFKINFDDYQLELAGVNNTAGDMYYHLALEKSPFHMPFGVSLVGKFGHPEVRLGGTKINDYRSEMVATKPTKPLDVNIMAWLHHGWLLFVQEAAKYEGKINEQ